MNLGILVIATGKYDVFIPPLWESVRKWMLPDTPHAVTMCVHADTAHADEAHVNKTDGRYALKWHQQEHLGWPKATLYRYHVFLKRADEWRSRFDYLLYMDADMRVVGPVGDEIFANLLAVRHPGFWQSGHAPFPHENRTRSRAFVPPHLRQAYYCGGVQGGAASTYLAVMNIMCDRINLDAADGITAAWHDESHWNHYLTMQQPPDKVLGPEYCVPEEFAATWPKPPKILALKKDHAKFQGRAR